MRRHPRIVAGFAGTVATLMVGVGIIYLTVACENLPGLLGPVAGDTSPRTPRGVIALVLGVAVFGFAALMLRRRPPSGSD